MSRPNLINGMGRTGIGRAPQKEHQKKANKKYIKEQAAIKKSLLEEQRRMKANREYEL
jgi:hypothetical protein